MFEVSHHAYDSLQDPPTSHGLTRMIQDMAIRTEISDLPSLDHPGNGASTHLTTSSLIACHVVTSDEVECDVYNIPSHHQWSGDASCAHAQHHTALNPLDALCFKDCAAVFNSFMECITTTCENLDMYPPTVNRLPKYNINI